MNTIKWNIILFVISTWFSLFLFIVTMLVQLLMTADIPIKYSSGEEKLFIVLLVLTTLTLSLMILFSKNFILSVTLSFGIILFLFLASIIRSYYKWGSENIDALTEWGLSIVFMVPTILGVVLIIKRKILSENGESHARL